MATIATPLLEAVSLSHSYASGSAWWKRAESHRVLRNVSLSIYPARTLGIVGESGSGKTTLCRLLLKLEQPTSGNVLFRGHGLQQLSSPQQRGFHCDVQAVFQDPFSSLNPRMTAAAILEEPFRAEGLYRNRTERRSQVESLMRLVGLDTSLLGRYPAQFSGGQRQRIAIARALALQPQLIIADEPVTALDVSVQAQIMNLLRELQEQRGVSYVFVSHNLNMVRFLCHDIVVMQAGRIVERGPTSSVFERPQHPYTRALFAATPTPDPDAVRPAPEALQVASIPSDDAQEIEVFEDHWILMPNAGTRNVV